VVLEERHRRTFNVVDFVQKRTEGKPMGKILVVYFSRTGYTKKVAEQIAARCGADLEAIEEVRDRSGIFGYLRSAREAYKKRPSEIRPATRNPSEYDLVIAGTPVWASNVSSPVRAYLVAQRGQLKQVAAFCTQGGSGAEKVLADMAELLGRQPVASVSLNDGEIKRDRYAEKLTRFIETLGLRKAA
jgi:flavodoxin